MTRDLEEPLERDRALMALALEQAEQAAALGEVPVGAVVAVDGEVIAFAHNERERSGDPTAHAELLAIRRAAAALGRWRLFDATVYVTLEPCPMCAGALVNARVARVVFGALDPKAGAARTLHRLLDDPRLNHQAIVEQGVAAAESAAALSAFFKRRRAERALKRAATPAGIDPSTDRPGFRAKAPPPADTIPAEVAGPLAAYFEAAHLKHLFRQGWLERGVPPARTESVAEHIFGVAMLALLFTPQLAPKLDISRALALALVHDLGEARAGDATPAQGLEKSEKARREREGLKSMLEALPDAAHVLELAAEYEAQATPEARWVKALDRLELRLQATSFERQGLKGLDDFFGALPELPPELSELAKKLARLRR